MAYKQLTGRVLARSQAFQILFQSEATGRPVANVLGDEYALEDGPLSKYGRKLAEGAGSCIETLDAIIDCVSDNWNVNRISSVDRNLLRIAVYEMVYVDEVDTAIAINEAVELAKIYGTDESPRFINGLLGRAARIMDEQDLVAYALEAKRVKDEKLRIAREAREAEEARRAEEERKAEEAREAEAARQAEEVAAYNASASSKERFHG